MLEPDHNLDGLMKEICELSEHNQESIKASFTRWSLQHLLDIEESIINEMMDVSNSDIGENIDFYHDSIFCDDGDDPCVYWGKVFFDEEFKACCNKKDIENHMDLLKNLSTKKYNDEYSKYIEQTLPVYVNTDRKIKNIIIVAGNLNDEALNFVDELKSSNEIDFEIYSLDMIYDEFSLKRTADLSIEYENSYEYHGSIMGHIKAKQIVDICEKNKSIFLYNPRGYLGNTIANISIKESLNDDEKKKIFWKLNNGVTAVCEKIINKNSDKHEYSYKNFKIVNGRQTAQLLIENKNNVDDNIKLFLSVHVTTDTSERDAISKATNTQNPIKPIDGVTNNEYILNFEKEIITSYKNWHFERQRRTYYDLEPEEQKNITLDRVLNKPDMLRKYYAFNKQPFNAVKYSQKTLFEPTNLEKILKKSKAIDFIIPHIFQVSLKKVYLENKSDKAYNLLKFQTIKYYTLSLIGISMEKLDSDDRSKCYDKICDLFDKSTKSDKLMEIAKTAYLRMKLFGTIFEITDDVALNRLFITKNKFEIIQSRYDINNESTNDIILDKLKNL